jgi:hypothetical protein
MLRIAFLTCVAAVCVRSSIGEEKLPQLPPEGAWARYHQVVVEKGRAERCYKSTIKVLGAEEVNGRHCRWIEFASIPDGQTAPGITQYLIPEKGLAESERPLDEAIRALTQDSEGNIVPETLEFSGINGTDMLFLPGARNNAKPVDEPQIVDYQSGRLNIPSGLRGEYTFRREAKTVKQTQSWTWEYTVWIDPKVSLGIARERFEMTQRIDGAVKRTFTQDVWLEDFGFDAKSSFAK